MPSTCSSTMRQKLAPSPSAYGKSGGRSSASWSFKVSRLHVTASTNLPCERRQSSTIRRGVTEQTTFNPPPLCTTPLVQPKAAKRAAAGRVSKAR
eukprot:4569976-Pleurochrysis_carterae.AAC.1